MISYSAQLSVQDYCQLFLIVMRLKPAIRLHRQLLVLAGANSAASFAHPYEESG
jgi:hypothetical protein